MPDGAHMNECRTETAIEIRCRCIVNDIALMAAYA